MTHYEIIKKLIGPIEPLGDASRDPERLENLKAIGVLAELLIADIEKVSQKKTSYESSVKLAVKTANEQLKSIKEITEYVF